MKNSTPAGGQPAFPAGLYIVATPIGNLGDLTARAAQLLAAADVIAAEDTRVTARLLAYLGIKVPMLAYHDHAAGHVRPALIARAATEVVALVSDAGTPLISDPGYKLVRDARAAGVRITTLPGPCAAIAALTLSGLPTDRFLFAGFLPAKAAARAEAIAELAPIKATLVLYESGKRLAASLDALAKGLGDREAVVAREISKLFEEVITAPLTSLAQDVRARPRKGEMVIVIAPPAAAAPADAATLEAALAMALATKSLKSAVAEVSAALGLPRAAVYARALALRQQEPRD